MPISKCSSVFRNAQLKSKAARDAIPGSNVLLERRDPLAFGAYGALVGRLGFWRMQTVTQALMLRCTLTIIDAFLHHTYHIATGGTASTVKVMRANRMYL
eukprot:1161503-Pelagomonas_calceolata.AAC.14